MTDFIENLRTAVERAKKSKLTDEQQAQLDAVHRIETAISQALDNEHISHGGVLDTELCLRSVAIYLGGLVGINTRTGGPAIQFTTAVLFCQLVIDAAMEVKSS